MLRHLPADARAAILARFDEPDILDVFEEHFGWSILVEDGDGQRQVRELNTDLTWTDEETP